ncbi:NAD(P)H-hydrate dehydratase [Gordonia hankookensis]|uniref:Bifunctional NAD(P)H-hydrate repair enzyme n=1 Tax=Gordonia hankookensis TaxID=589403 RepID=A0ABR7WE32_9ACTN|nr:NAD(P)H-hydrate dehydratase [Gordonia hankookensis]MBD1321018.1 NAD(P)H-hydrate dehydratase [Gordonia hankookensis]
MPIRYLTADAVRQAERATGDLLTGGALMRRASSGVAQVVIGELRATGGCYGRRVGGVIGAGDNGGDALYALAVLAHRGVACTAVLLNPDRAHPGGLAAFCRAGGRIAETLPSGLDLVIDGVVGIGGRGPLRSAAADQFARLERAESGGPAIVAVDLPSGVDADTGEVHDPAVQATITVTFGAPRNAHLLAAPQCGRVEVIDIGIDRFGPSDGPAPRLSVLADDDVAGLWPVPGPDDDKYSQGVVGVIAGSARYPGAAILATGAAVSATSGMTRYVGTAADEVVSHYPEVVAARTLDDAGRVQAWVVGPGMGTDDDALAVLRTVLETDLPVLVDADGLTLVAAHPELVADRRAPTLLTPHAGEYARLAGDDVGADRLQAAAGLAAKWQVTVLLKGRITLVADPSGDVLGNDAGSSWAATAGAGDVLSGIAGALMASGLTPSLAGAAAARVHGHAADLAARSAPIGASALLGAVRPAVRAIREASAIG